MAKAGEWLRYGVTVQTAGTYNVEVRVAAQGAGGQFHLAVDGKAVSGKVNVPDTKNWNGYTTVVVKGVKLPAGSHGFYLMLDKNGKSGYVGNFNQFRLVKTADAPAATTTVKRSTATSSAPTVTITPGKTTSIQAEDFDSGANGVAYKDWSDANEGGEYRKTGVDIEKSADSRGGYNVTMKQGEWLNYTVNVSKAGTFNLDTRVAGLYGNASFHIEVDGKNVSGSMKFVNTGGFQNWTTVRKSGIKIAAGKHTIKVVVDSSGGHKYAANLNWLMIS
jgi:hypothetical protein